jgi:uncharacterized membrane protein YphA (DoxX/SURF4 family)
MGGIEMATKAAEADLLASWRLSGIGFLRILFGIVWGIDAWFKWQPGFVNNFKDYLANAQQNQPWPVHHWIGFWVNTVGVDPTVFAYLVAVAETAIALALILGVLMNLTSVLGVLLTVVIWSTAEGFGGPYQAGSTDIGAAIIYALVFAGLFLSSAGLYYGLDRRLTPRLGNLGVLASGWFQTRAATGRAASTGLSSPS